MTEAESDQQQRPRDADADADAERGPGQSPRGGLGQSIPSAAHSPRELPGLILLMLNLVFYGGAVLVTLLFTVVGAVVIAVMVLMLARPRDIRYVIRRMISHYGAAVIRMAWPWVTVRYHDHAPADRPPFIATANHRAASDAFLMAFLPFETIQVVNIWPFKIPWIGLMAKIAGYLSVREMPIDQFYERGGRLLRQGVCIACFPEGTRSGSRRMGRFNSSAFRLAMRAGVPVVPLAITGNERTPPRGSMLLRPSVVRVHKLPAVTAAEYRQMDSFKLKNLVRDRIQAHVDQIELDRD